MEARLVMSTAGSEQSASALAHKALEAKLAACVNVIPNVTSHYWWHDKIQSEPEVVMLFKTRLALVADLEALIRREHPYDTPEFVVLAPEAVEQKYLRWLLASCTP